MNTKRERGPELIEGLYELTADVDAPNPDRRVSRDWRAQVTWKKGTQFVVNLYPGHGDELAAELIVRGERYGSIHAVGPWSDEWKALAPHLKPIEDKTHEALCDVYGASDGALLERLLADGVVTLPHLFTVAKALQAERVLEWRKNYQAFGNAAGVEK